MKKSNSKLISFILILVGATLSYLGYQQSQAVVARLSNSLIGGYSNETMALFILGAVCLISGIYLFFRK